MANAKVIISAEDKLSQGLLSAKKQMMQFQQSVQKVGDTLKTAFNVTVIAVAVKKITDAATDCTKQFLEMERKYKQLRFTLGSGEAFKSVSDNIKKLTRITLSAKGDVESMVSELAALGKTADDINRISDAAVNLSNVTGQNLNSSMTTLLNTLNGNTRALNKLGIETSQFTKQELASGAAIDLVNQKFGELSKQMAEADTSQHIKNIKDTIGDLKQAVGDVINFNIAPIVANIDVELTGLFEKIVSYIDYIGATIMNFPTVLGLVGQTFTKMVEKLFTWDTLKTGVTNIVSYIGKVLINLTDSISQVIDSIVTAVIAEIAYIASSLYSELVDAILRALGTSEEAFSNSTIGKILGFTKKVTGAAQVILGIAANPTTITSGEDLSKVSQSLIRSGANNIAGASPADTTRALKESADRAFESIGTNILKSFQTIFDFGEDAISGISSFAKDNFGEIFSEFVSNLDTVVQPTLDLINKARQERQTGSGTTVTKTDIPVESDANFGKGVLNAFTSAMGDAGKVISDVVTNIATYGTGLGLAMTGITQAFEGMASVIGDSLNRLVSLIVTPFKMIGRFLGESILPVIEELSNSLSPIVTLLSQMFGMLITSLAPVVQCISSILSPVLAVISGVLEALMPVIKVFAKVVVTITGTIQYVVQTLQHWVATVMNWLADLSIFGWHPFGGLRMNDPGAPGKYSDYIQSKWATVDAAFESASTAGTAVGTAVSSAGYQGATQVTINIYQEAPVVGEGGMREFAKMIKEEFENLNYYGVTA